MVMTGVTRWDPLKEMEALQNRLSGLFGRAHARRGNGEQESITVAEWAPLVDITEDDKEYLIKAELPEVKKEDVKVAVENGVLTISGERKSEKEEKNKKYHRIERAYGSFERSHCPGRCRRRQSERGVQGRRAQGAPAQERKSQTQTNRSQSCVNCFACAAAAVTPPRRPGEFPDPK